MKRTISLILITALTLVALAAFTGCKGSSATTITIAASPTPHAEILEIVKEILAEKGITLKVYEYADYVQPNLVVDNGDLDANYFQHKPYLDDFNSENGTNLVSVATIHVEPLGLYAGKRATIDALKEGGAQIAVPNDTTNEGRALLLLQQNGLITLSETAGLKATKRDIVSNPYNIEITEMDAQQLPNVLNSVDFAIINSNFAISAGINPVTDSLLIEDGYSAYGNIVTVKAGNENTDKTKALVAALMSKRVADYIAETYDGAVVSTVTNPGDGYDSTVDYENFGK